MECIITNTLYWFHTIFLKTRKTQFLRINGTSPSTPKYSHFDCGLVTSSWGTSNEIGAEFEVSYQLGCGGFVGGGRERRVKNRSPKAPIEDDCYYICGNPSSSRRLTKSLKSSLESDI